MNITSFRIREELQDPLEALAEELDRPKTWIINEAIAAYLRQADRRQRIYRETLEGLADVEAGRLVDGDEVLAWVESWGTENELPPPRVK